ncbi:hypothetical protein R1sor_011690 [Riccia sorocarpa]|uniref:Uncharacterized protein n=1 Tax=Riccia sorocarpa TaxID=122646 RepID=A0ABD3I3H4_9MARC
MANGRRFIDGVLGGRSQIRPINVDDIGNHLWWTHFRPEEIARLTAGVPPKILSRLGLDDFLSLQFARPNTEAVAEFIRNYSKDTHQSTVRGQQINLCLEAIRDAFHLLAGTTMCPKMKKGLHIEDWFDYYDEKKKAFWSNLCLKPGIIQDVAPVDPGPENQVPQEGDSSEDESIPPGDHHEEDDEPLVPVGGGVKPPANDQPAAQDTIMEEVLPNDPSREGSAEAGQSLPSHAKAGPSSSYREESGANLGSTQANRLERSKDLEPRNSGSEVRGPYIVHPIPSTIPSLLALRSDVEKCQPGDASRHSMEVDVSPDITKNPDTSGSEFLIVPRRVGASMHLPWAQSMEEDVRPEISALSVPLGTNKAQDRNCTLAVENNAGVSSKHTLEQYCQEDRRDIIDSANRTRK